jgi:pimeloyl-ACP methyl ester carboxylesterase
MMNVDRTFAFEGQAVRWGTAGSGPPLVLVHGTPFSSLVWRRIVPILAGVRTVFWFDLLGYGRSEMRDGQDVSLGVQNRVLGALLDHLQIDVPDVVAHDFGGATTLRALILDRRRFRTLTLIDPVALSPWGSPFVKHVRDHEAAFSSLPAYIHRALVEAYVKGAAFRPLPAEALATYVEPWLGEVGQSAFYRQIAQMDLRFTDEIRSGLGSIDTPTLIVWGERDEWIPIERGRELAAIIPGAAFLPVSNAGHLVQEDAPEAIVGAAMNFVLRR